MPLSLLRAGWWLSRRSRSALVVWAFMTLCVVSFVLAIVLGARRTASAVDRFTAATAAEDVQISQNRPGSDVERLLAADEGVAAYTRSDVIVGRVDAERIAFWSVLIPPMGDGGPRPILLRGRLPASGAADEVVIHEAAALSDGFDLDVGDSFDWTPLSVDEYFSESGFAAGAMLRNQVHRLRIVGVIRTISDIAAPEAEPLIVGTPALAAASSNSAVGHLFRVQLRPGVADIDDLAASLPSSGDGIDGLAEVAPLSLAAVLAPVRRTLHMQSVGLGVLALMSAAAGVAAIRLLTRRILVDEIDSVRTLRDLGATNWQRRLVAASPFALPCVLIAAGAVPVATLASQWFPLGDAARIEPHKGPFIDLMASGLAIPSTLVLLAGGVLIAAARPSRLQVGVRSKAVITLWSPWRRGPITLRLGGHLASANAKGVSSIVIVAVSLCGAAVILRSSLAAVSSDPVRSGASADVELGVTKGEERSALAQLETDPAIDQLTGRWYGQIRIDEISVPASSFQRRRGEIGAVVLRGREPVVAGEVLLGTRTAKELGASVGTAVTIATPDGTEALEVVGVGLLPSSTSQYAEAAVLTHSDLAAFTTDGMFFRALATLRVEADRTAAIGRLAQSFELEDLASPSSRPPPVRNLLQLGPIVELGEGYLFALAAIVVAAMASLALRSQRACLAVLGALGVTPRQRKVSAGVAGGHLAACGLAVGVPLAVWLGRFVWSRVASLAYLSPAVTVPARLLGALALVTVALAVAGSVIAAGRITFSGSSRFERT